MHGPRRRPHRPRPRRIFAAGRRRCRRRPCRPCLAAPSSQPAPAPTMPLLSHTSCLRTLDGRRALRTRRRSHRRRRRRLSRSFGVGRALPAMRTRYSVVSHEALAVSHESPAPLAPPIFGPAAVHDVSSPILLPLSQPHHPRASTRRAVAGARPGLICEAVLWAKLEPYRNSFRI